MTPETFLDGRVTLHPGDCLEVLARLEDCSIDSCVTDPPYHLQSIHKRFAAKGRDETSERYAAGPYGRTARGFMGKQWDGGDIAFRPELWAEVLRVLKPGAHLLAFSGTRTYHRMACAIEDAGFEVRDMIGWLYGSGFPKSHNQKGDWQGWGTALKPAQEPVCFARKPLIGTVAENVQQHGTGAVNIAGCRVGTEERHNPSAQHNDIYGQFQGAETEGRTVAGRWPANIVHDGSDEVVQAFPVEAGAFAPVRGDEPSNIFNNVYGARKRPGGTFHADSGSAARFFYTAKADADDRLGSKHPTVKPLDLIQYFSRLVTPPGGVVLDPFAGTGTTGEAAWREGFRAVLIEREAEYQEDIRRRMKFALGGPEERRREIIKAKGLTEDAGPLFDGVA